MMLRTAPYRHQTSAWCNLSTEIGIKPIECVLPVMPEARADIIIRLQGRDGFSRKKTNASHEFIQFYTQPHRRNSR